MIVVLIVLVAAVLIGAAIGRSTVKEFFPIDRDAQRERHDLDVMRARWD